MLSAQTGGLNAPQAVGPYFNNTFPVTAPGLATGWATENAFPNLTFVDPLYLTPIPGGNEFLLVGKNGQLWRFANNPAVTQGQVVKVPLAQDELNGPRGESYRKMISASAAGRAGKPDEIGELAALLMSEAGAFITGSDILIDGGVTAAYFYGSLAI